MAMHSCTIILLLVNILFTIHAVDAFFWWNPDPDPKDYCPERASGVCKPLAAPTDGQINCGDSTIFYRCTAQCNSGYGFDNGDSTIEKDCDPMTGQFFSGPAFPKCIPTCSPACQNGVTCVQPNVCFCAPGWNGTFCESLDGGGPGSNPFGFGSK